MQSTPWAVFLTVLAATAPLPPLAAQEPAAPRPDVRAVGTASRSVRPDLATITLDFYGEGATPTQANQRAAALADSLRRAFQGLGIPRDSLVTAQREYWGRGRVEKTYATRLVAVPNGPPGATWQKQDTVYRAHDGFQVRIRDLAKVAAVIDTAIAYGILQVSTVEFSATAMNPARNEALRLAAVDAREQAQAMAEASGARLGRLLSLTTQPNQDPDPRGPLLSIRSGTDALGTQVVAPQLKVTATVFARWELVAP